MNTIKAAVWISILVLGIGLWCMPVPMAEAAPMVLQPAEEAKVVVARARGAYANLRGYSDRSEFCTVYETGNQAKPVPVKANLVFSSPSSFRVDLTEGAWFGPGGLVSDGKTLSEYAINSGAYVQKPAMRGGGEGGDGGGVEVNFDERDGVAMSAPWHLALLLAGKESPEFLFDGIRTIEGYRAQVKNERAGKLVVARGTMPGQPASVESDVDWFMWFDDETGLLGEVVLDMTKRQQKLSDEAGESVNGQGAITRFASILTLHDVVPNPAIAPATFVFKPEPEAVKVERFRNPGETGVKFAELIGSPAPEFETAAASGGKFKLSDLKGRVVVLDFWATWCGPCVQAIPLLQKLSESLKQESVSFVGVNQDRGMSVEKLNEWLEKKKITIPQVLDESGEVGSNFRVSGIPHLVVIDQKGIVQQVEVGFGKESATKLETTIRDLLAGKAVNTPEQLAAMKAESQDTSEVGVLRWEKRSQALPEGVAKIPEKNTGWLNVQGKTAFGLNGNRLVECDLGAAGGIVFISPCWDGTSAIVQYKVSDQTSRRVVLKDLGGRSVIAAFAFPSGSEARYLACSSKNMANSWLQSQLLISCHDAAGKQIWKYEPPLTGEFEASVNLFAADVWSSGAMNPIVALNANYTKKISENSYETIGTLSQLLVLDEGGEVQVSKPIGTMEAPVIRRVQDAGSGKAAILLVSGGQVDRIDLPQKKGK